MTNNRRHISNSVLYVLLICSVAFCIGPTNKSINGIIDWVYSGGQIASGTGPLPPSVASEGAMYVDISTPTTPVLYRVTNGTLTPLVGGGGGGGDATTSALLASHVAQQVDPHGATTTFTVGVTVGTGTPETFFGYAGTGTMGIGSYVLIPPEFATPTGEVATCTLWYDANTKKLRAYDGTWHDLW